MGHVHSRERILRAAVEVVQEVGLAELTYRRVGAHLAIPDRTVVYYFRTKVELILAVLDVVAGKVGEAMAAMLDEHDLTIEQAAGGMWRSLASAELDPYFRVYVELLGLAVSRRSPYDELMPRIYQEWVAWLEPRMCGPLEKRRAAAIAAFALVDGLLIVRHLGLTEIAEEGATTFTLPRNNSSPRGTPSGADGSPAEVSVQGVAFDADYRADRGEARSRRSQ